MEKRKLKVGDILQIDPEHDSYGGCLLICTEPKEWGCQGYLYSAYPLENVCRFKGLAFLRVTWPYLQYVGHIEWIIDNSDKEEGVKDGD